MNKVISNIYGVNGDDYTCHRAVKAFFPEESRVLFRRDHGRIRVQSSSAPVQKTADFNPNWECEVLNHNATITDDVDFVIRYNPTKMLTGSRKIIPLFGEDAIDWLTMRLEEALDISVIQAIAHDIVNPVKLDGTRLTLNSVHARVAGSIKSREKLETLVESGLGRGKAFGFGMIDVLR